MSYRLLMLRTIPTQLFCPSPVCFLSVCFCYCNCSVPSQLRAKIHFKSAAPIGFLPSRLSFLTVSAVNAQTCGTVTCYFLFILPHCVSHCTDSHQKIRYSLLEKPRRTAMRNSRARTALTVLMDFNPSGNSGRSVSSIKI